MAELRDQLQATLGDSFAIERELAGGGMSRVFVAVETALGREVVIKVLPPEMAADVSIDRFKREIMLAARLQHAHIVPLLTAGESSGLAYFTMPFVSGESLRARLTSRGELPITEAVRVLREIASALAYAHERGIVHRDIKPDNVLLSGDSAVVTDFGVAKALSASTSIGEGAVTSKGIALGTPAYMAPEQATADPSVDHRADIYSFGVLAYEILTGSPPFTGRPAHALLAAQATETPEPILRRRETIPPALAALVMRCLEKRPADRPQTAAEIVRSLDDVTISSEGVSAYRASAAAGRRPSRGPIILGGAALIALVAIAGWFLFSRSRATPAAPAAKSIAVFPFENASGDTSMAFFADGMAYELASALSQAGIRVAGRASVAAVQAKHTADQEAGRLLGVQTLLHGSVRRSGSRLRVWTQLVNSSDGIALWTRTYDTTLTDVFNVQDDLARGIVRELQQSLGRPSVVTRAGSRGTNDLAAYDLFMKGRYYTDKFQSERAIAALDSAVARDPKFARAYAKLARAYGALASGGVVSADSTRQLEWRAAQRALELDSTLAESQAAMGVALSDEWRFAESEAAYKRAVALEPDNPDILSGYAALLFSLGRITESLVQSRHLVELDPLSVNAVSLVQYALVLLGRLEEARAETKRGLELDSTLIPLLGNAGLIAVLSGQPDMALMQFKKAYDLDSTQFGNAAWLMYGYAVAGRWDDVDRVRAKIERDGGGNSPNFFKTIIAIVDGDRDKAVTYLERGFAAREPLFLFLSASCDPSLDLIKSEPRYRALMQRYGMRICPPLTKWPIPARRKG